MGIIKPIVCGITQEMERWAEMEAERRGFGRTYKGMGGDDWENKKAGVLGELLFFQRNKRFNWDALKGNSNHDFTLRQHKVDVKTSRGSGEPHAGFRNTLPIDDLKRYKGKEFFIFCVVKYDYSLGYLLGWIFAGDFHKKSIFCPKGKPRAGRGGLYLCDCREISITELEPLRQ
jgi:hypothetical protein